MFRFITCYLLNIAYFNVEIVAWVAKQEEQITASIRGFVRSSRSRVAEAAVSP